MTYKVGLASGIVFIVVAGFFALSRISNGASAADVARHIVDTCSQGSDHEQCYEHEVPLLYGTLSIPQIFDVIRQIRVEDPTYQFCHVLAHELGEKVVAQDPAKWLNAIPLNPSDGMCSNGFIHGVIVGRFRNDVLDDAAVKKAIPDFSRACEAHAGWQPSILDQAICYHGMGHLYTFITNADLPRALSICKATTESPSGSFLRVCSEGVFMQIYQPLEPDDFLLVKHLPIKPTAANYRKLCSAFKDPDQQGACLREAWPLLYKEVQSGTGVAEFCHGQPVGETHACYESASAIVGRMSLQNTEQAATACGHFPSSEQATCFIASAQAQIEEDRSQGKVALELCNRAPTDIASLCVKALADRAAFLFQKGSPELDSFCKLVQEQYQTSCHR